MNPVFNEFDVFAGFDLLRLVRKLLVVLQTSLRIGQIFLKRALRILSGERRHAVAVLKFEVLEIGGVGEGILRENNVALAVAGIVEQFRYPSAGIRSTHINHPGTQWVEDGLAVIE